MKPPGWLPSPRPRAGGRRGPYQARPHCPCAAAPPGCLALGAPGWAFAAIGPWGRREDGRAWTVPPRADATPPPPQPPGPPGPAGLASVTLRPSPGPGQQSPGRNETATQTPLPRPAHPRPAFLLLLLLGSLSGSGELGHHGLGRLPTCPSAPPPALCSDSPPPAPWTRMSRWPHLCLPHLDRALQHPRPSPVQASRSCPLLCRGHPPGRP